ncbi:4-methylaminobutanoate oxidase [bacterium MnTg02]|nr:4-methylaminobutanoate oxidase [bacterium MnTg02]
MPENKLPSHARVVIIGGGIVGCSVAYHLAKQGWSDIVLLEQGRLSGGTTWHAAGLVGQLRSHENMTRLIRYSTELYASLEEDTGQATGWKQCGSLTVARSEDRMTVLKRTAAKARAFGVEAEIISPNEAAKLWPIMRSDDLVGAVWLPGDGKANPTDLTQALAKGARQRGAKIFEKTRVTNVLVKDGTVTGVETGEHSITSEFVVNCAGQWARQLGRMCGVTVPLYSAEHMYMVSGPIDGVHPDLPCLRDPDGYIYFKEEVGGVVMGGFEPDTKPWNMDRIPDDFEFTLLEDDWDQFEILMENALHRLPALESAEVKQFINGPESFTPDSNFILGEAPELRNFYVGAGFNSMGIASAGGAGMALAEWIVNGAPTHDLWPVDIRRFARFHGNNRWLKERTKETLGLHYAMPWPNLEFSGARPLRRSPIYHLLAARGACFGSKMGWERPLWFAGPESKPEIDYSFGRQNWFDIVATEHKAARAGVALFDQSSFSKFLVQGQDSEAVLQRLCANDIAVPAGRCVYTGLLNERGGYESDLTVTRLDDKTFLLVTGSAQTTRDQHWLCGNIRGDEMAVVTDVTGAYAVFGLMGPKSRDLLSRLTSADLSNAAFPFATSRNIDIGYATVRATRMTYVGELGWELYVPVEFAVGVYEDLIAEGADIGLQHAGYYALETLRLEKAYRAWGAELSPDYTPLEAGLGFAVCYDKAIPFIGRDALVKQAREGVKRRLVQFVLNDREAILYGGELILRDGQPVGDLKSASFGHTLGASVGLGYVHSDDGVDKSFIAQGTYQIDVAGVLVPATAHIRPPYDPKGERVRA